MPELMQKEPYTDKSIETERKTIVQGVKCLGGCGNDSYELVGREGYENKTTVLQCTGCGSQQTHNPVEGDLLDFSRFNEVWYSEKNPLGLIGRANFNKS